MKREGEVLCVHVVGVCLFLLLLVGCLVGVGWVVCWCCGCYVG